MPSARDMWHAIIHVHTKKNEWRSQMLMRARRLCAAHMAVGLVVAAVMDIHVVQC